MFCFSSPSSCPQLSFFKCPPRLAPSQDLSPFLVLSTHRLCLDSSDFLVFKRAYDPHSGGGRAGESPAWLCTVFLPPCSLSSQGQRLPLYLHTLPFCCLLVSLTSGVNVTSISITLLLSWRLPHKSQVFSQTSSTISTLYVECLPTL